jgi:hypothetical protein
MLKRTALVLTLAAALLAASGGPGTAYEWDYFTDNRLSIAGGAACWGLGAYFAYTAFCPACVGAGLIGTAACMAAGWG